MSIGLGSAELSLSSACTPCLFCGLSQLTRFLFISVSISAKWGDDYHNAVRIQIVYVQGQTHSKGLLIKWKPAGSSNLKT